MQARSVIVDGGSQRGRARMPEVEFEVKRMSHKIRRLGASSICDCWRITERQSEDIRKVESGEK